MSLQDKFTQKSLNERSLMVKLLQKLPSNYDWKYYFTDESGYDKYDCLLYKYNKDTYQLIDRYFIECKVRDTHYTSLMLEYDKLKSLFQLTKSKDKKDNEQTFNNTKSKIVYLTITPKGSYWFDINEIDLKSLDWVDEYHWDSSTDKSRGKIYKKVAYLPIDLAKVYDTTTNDLESIGNIVNRVITHQQQYKCLFEFLIGTNEKEEIKG